MTNNLPMIEQGAKTTMQLVAEYGFVYVFAVIMAVGMMVIAWKVAQKLVLSDNSMADQALKNHFEFTDTTKKTMQEVKEAVVEGKIIARSIDSTLVDHTSMLKQDTSDLKAVKATAERIETKVNSIHCQV